MESFSMSFNKEITKPSVVDRDWSCAVADLRVDGSAVRVCSNRVFKVSTFAIFLDDWIWRHNIVDSRNAIFWSRKYRIVSSYSVGDF